MMDFFDSIRHVIPGGGALESLPPGRWDPVSFTPDRSVAGKKIGKVTGHGVGAKGASVWTYFTYQRTDDHSVHTVWATSSSPGTAQVFLADGEHDPDDMGTEQENGRVAIHPIFVPFPPQTKTSVAVMFDKDGKTVEYRFDGRNWP
jgi:hypothetical protein